MSQSKPTKKNARGRRAEGKTATTISLSEELLEEARKLAAEDGRSFSNWVERLLLDALKKAGKLSLFAFTAWHAARSASDWSPAALAQSARSAVAVIASAL